jgi:hypothetical protein
MRDGLFNDNSSNVVDRFWQINKTGGSGTLTVTFTYSPGEEPSTGEAGLVSQVYNTPSKAWVAPLPSQSANTTNNTVTTPGVTNFGSFALSKLSTPLPIELLTFSAKVNSNKKVDLNWSTASEINNDYFTVQRSADLEHIEEIENVDGAGNSSQTLHYHTLDNNPLKGISYYRLKQTDFDGKTKFLHWQSVELNDNQNLPGLIIQNVYPNPFNDEIRIDFSIEKAGNVSMRLVNEAGQLIFSDMAKADEGSNSYLYSDKSGLAVGIYYFIVQYNDFVKTLKVVKKN